MPEPMLIANGLMNRYRVAPQIVLLLLCLSGKWKAKSNSSPDIRWIRYIVSAPPAVSSTKLYIQGSGLLLIYIDTDIYILETIGKSMPRDWGRTLNNVQRIIGDEFDGRWDAKTPVFIEDATDMGTCQIQTLISYSPELWSELYIVMIFRLESSCESLHKLHLMFKLRYQSPYITCDNIFQRNVY